MSCFMPMLRIAPELVDGLEFCSRLSSEGNDDEEDEEGSDESVNADGAEFWEGRRWMKCCLWSL